VYPIALADLSSLINKQTNSTNSSQSDSGGGADGGGDDGETTQSEYFSEINEVFKYLGPVDPTDPQEVTTVVMLQQSILASTKDIEAQVVVSPPVADPFTGVVALDPEEVARRQKVEAEGKALRQEVRILPIVVVCCLHFKIMRVALTNYCNTFIDHAFIDHADRV